MKISYIFGISMLILAGCGPAGGALKPVATQNQQNLIAMSRNLQLLINVHETLLKSASNTLLFQQLAKTEAELIAVVGTPQLPLKSNTWEEAIDLSSKTFVGKKSKFLQRFQAIKTSLASNLSPDKRQQLSINEGWLFSAVANNDFTPETAHETLKALAEVRQTNATTGNNYAFYEEAMRRLKSIDPRLEYIENTIKAAHVLLNALKQELLKEMELALAHSRAFANYAQAEVDPQSTLKNFAGNALNEVINSLANKYIQNPLLRKASVSLLMKGSDAFTNNLLGD